MAMTKSEKIWMNGQFVDWDDAKVHVLSHVLHYGSSVFEGIRCYHTKQGPAIFRLGEHIERLAYSSKIYRMKVPFSSEQIERACLDTVAVNGLQECYIRPLVYRGYCARGREPDRHADRRHGGGVPVGQVPRRRRAHEGRVGEGRHLGAHGAEHAAGDGEGGRQLPELAAAQARGGGGRLRRGHRARHERLHQRGLGREPVPRHEG
jgi:hypothetical protein